MGEGIVMSNISLIIGESGTGKSTSIRNLNPLETFIINVIDKPLPFKGYRAKYKSLSPDGMEGNYYATDDYAKVIKVANHISTKRLDIKTIIIDDFQFIMTNEFMRRCMERGFDKFSEIGNHAWSILNALKSLREDIDCFILSHSEMDETGKMKLKTIGKLLSEKYGMETAVSMLLQTQINDGTYSFVTQGDARHIAKSPMGMFEDKVIPNDLAFVKNKMNQYYNEDVAL